MDELYLRRHVDEGVEVLQVEGPVEDSDVDALTAVLHEALGRGPRGVVVDLSGADRIAPAAVEALRRAAGRSGPWPHTTLVVCAPPDDVRPNLAGQVQLRSDREDALRHIDDRTPAVREVTVVRHDLHGPAEARGAVRTWCDRFGLGDLCDDLLLVVSELVTNAVRYGRPPVVLELEASTRAVTVAVADGTPTPPGRREAGFEAESGRGLLLIDLLAAESGVRPDPPGKAVWAELPRRTRGRAGRSGS